MLAVAHPVNWLIGFPIMGLKKTPTIGAHHVDSEIRDAVPDLQEFNQLVRKIYWKQWFFSHKIKAVLQFFPGNQFVGLSVY